MKRWQSLGGVLGLGGIGGRCEYRTVLLTHVVTAFWKLVPVYALQQGDHLVSCVLSSYLLQENILAILEQINHWFDPSKPETLGRGSAITGKSTHNCRIEYLWRYVCLACVNRIRNVCLHFVEVEFFICVAAPIFVT